jgi:transposase
MYFIGLDVHKRTISYCVKDAAGRVFQEGKIGMEDECDIWERGAVTPALPTGLTASEKWSG